MSTNPFITSNNNPFQINNKPFIPNNNNNNQQNSINTIFKNNINTTNNLNQIQSSENKISTNFNLFNNKSEISTSNINIIETNKKDVTTSFNTGSFNNNIFANLNNNNINKEEQKTNLTTINISSNINTNINTNNNNTNDIGFNFFNINEKKDKKEEITNNNAKNEEKKESNNIFLAQSNNILNKINKDNNLINENDINKNKNILNLDNINDINKSKSKSIISGLSINSNINKNEDKEVNEFLKNLLVEDKLVIAQKEMTEYEKKQLSAKLGGEIIDELRTQLNSNREEFKRYINNTRLLEEKYYQTNKIIKKNIENSVQKEIKYNNLLFDLNNISKYANNLDTKISIRHKNISDALDYLMNSNNPYNYNLINIKKVDFEENNSFYKDLKEISRKVRKIDDDLNVISNNIDKNDRNERDTEKILYEKYNRKNGNNNEIYSINSNMEGVWIKRDNMENQIYIEEKEVNGLFKDCYNGLNGLIAETEHFNEIYNNLKSKLINRMNKNNNLETTNTNDKYNKYNNININNLNNNNTFRINN